MGIVSLSDPKDLLLPFLVTNLFELPNSFLDESYKRGCQEKFFPLPLRREMAVVACIQPNLSSGEAVGSLRIPDSPSQLAFMTRWSFDAFGSGSYASKSRRPKWANHGPI
jgi:hypothetical protein